MFDNQKWREAGKGDVSLVMLFSNINRWEKFSHKRFEEIQQADIFSEAVFVVNNKKKAEKIKNDFDKDFSGFPIRLIFNNENNIPMGRNIGVRETRNRTIFIWDDDDRCDPDALYSAFHDIYLPRNFRVMELPLSHGDGSSFHPQPPELMPQCPYPGRNDLIVVGMVHTPFFVSNDLLTQIPFPEAMAIRGDWFHWSTELYRAGVPIVCMKQGKVAFETPRERFDEITSGGGTNTEAYKETIISLLYMFYRYDVEIGSEYGRIIRRRYLDRYCPDDSKIIWPELATIGKQLRSYKEIDISDFYTKGDFGDLLTLAYKRVAKLITDYGSEHPKPKYDVAPFEIFTLDRRGDLEDILGTKNLLK